MTKTMIITAGWIIAVILLLGFLTYKTITRISANYTEPKLIFNDEVIGGNDKGCRVHKVTIYGETHYYIWCPKGNACAI